MRRPRTRASLAELALLVALIAWALFPVALLVAHALHDHARLTGADGLIGVDGVLGADQLQYLAWARDAGNHGLISDLFSLAPSGHVYLQPLFLITGALWRLGLSLPLAYLLWKPIAAIALFLAALAWARRLFADQLGARAAMVALALFLYTPVAALVSWATLGSSAFRFQMYLIGDELLPANKLWGYVPSALGLALMALALLAVERSLVPTGTRTACAVALGSLAALLSSLLHPWQGATMLLVFAGLAVWQRLRGAWLLIPPALGAGLPLLYYLVLSHADPAWRLAAQNEAVARLTLAVLLAGLGPLVLVALAGLRRPGQEVAERVLLLWIPACLITYFALDAFAPHALQGLSFPIGALIVRGWQRSRAPALLGALAVALLTIPGLAYSARKFAEVARGHAVQYYLPRSDARALDWLAGPAPAGGVLAPVPFAIVIPSQTGRAVWVGHGYWSRDYAVRAKQANRLFGGRMRPGAARAFVLGTRAPLLFADCSHPANLNRLLGPIVQATHRFGCARVYVIKRT